GITRNQVNQWIERYKAQGITGLKHRPLGRYTKELKLKVVLEYLKGNTSYPQLCSKYNISNVSTVYQWVHRYTSGKELTTRSAKP
ncbi:helix-turn-helix domain-containing protein, partial [Staphylococcus epidermidis]